MTLGNTSLDQSLLQNMRNSPGLGSIFPQILLAKIEVEMPCHGFSQTPDGLIFPINVSGKSDQFAARHILPVNKLANPAHTIRVMCEIHNDTEWQIIKHIQTTRC